MSSGTGRLVLATLLCCLLPLASGIPAWSDLFSQLSPSSEQEQDDGDVIERKLFVDQEEEEAGTPRLGFIQLNTGTTAFNTTLNLTGHILLGLGIASSLLLYMYFKAFNQDDGYGYDDGGYDRRKRSAFNGDFSDFHLIPELLEDAEEKVWDTLNESSGSDKKKRSGKRSCFALAACEAMRHGRKFKGTETVGHGLREIFGMMDLLVQSNSVADEKGELTPPPRHLTPPLIPFYPPNRTRDGDSAPVPLGEEAGEILSAMRAGKAGKDCKEASERVAKHCRFGLEEVLHALES